MALAGRDQHMITGHETKRGAVLLEGECRLSLEQSDPLVALLLEPPAGLGGMSGRDDPLDEHAAPAR